ATRSAAPGGMVGADRAARPRRRRRVANEVCWFGMRSIPLKRGPVACATPQTQVPPRVAAIICPSDGAPGGGVTSWPSLGFAPTVPTLDVLPQNAGCAPGVRSTNFWDKNEFWGKARHMRRKTTQTGVGVATG